MNTHPTAATFAFHEAPTLPERPRSRLGRAEGLTVLVIEDDPDARYIFSECLLHLGYRTASAATGELGVRMALRVRPTAILMDLEMPGIGGIEATRRIKADPRTSDCLVIVVTAQGASMHDRAREAGCDAYFCKPFNAFLLDRVLRLMDMPPGLRSSRAHKHGVTRCDCSRGFTFDAWLALPLSGRMHVPGCDIVFELRNCDCGSSIAMSV